jgi:hypothetical protein
MVWRGETILTPTRASEMIKRDRLSPDYIKFINDNLSAALNDNNDCVKLRPDGSKFITNHDNFNVFIWCNLVNLVNLDVVAL